MLEIVLGEARASRRPIVLADTPGSTSALAARALTASALTCTRLLFSAPPLTAAPDAVRRWHRDLWNALPASDRRRVMLVVGETAQYLAPLLGEGTRVVTFVADAVEAALALGLRAGGIRQLEASAGKDGKPPRAIVARLNAQSRALLGPWHDLGEIPVGKGAPPNADEWRAALLEDVLTRVSAHPTEATAEETAKIADSFKWIDKLVGRYLESARPSLAQKVSETTRERLAAFCWLDAELRQRVATAGRTSR